jgi:hypothetical protein
MSSNSSSLGLEAEEEDFAPRRRGAEAEAEASLAAFWEVCTGSKGFEPMGSQEKGSWAVMQTSIVFLLLFLLWWRFVSCEVVLMGMGCSYERRGTENLWQLRINLVWKLVSFGSNYYSKLGLRFNRV